MRKYGITEKMAERWAKNTLKSYMETEEYQIEKSKIEKDFLDFMLYGVPSAYFDEDGLKTLRTEYLDIDTIIERYNLTDKEIEDLKKLKGDI